MSAIPQDFIEETARLSAEVTKPFPKSRRIYVEGSRPDIQVPMREILQDDTPTLFGEEENPPVTYIILWYHQGQNAPMRLIGLNLAHANLCPGNHLAGGTA